MVSPVAKTWVPLEETSVCVPDDDCAMVSTVAKTWVPLEETSDSNSGGGVSGGGR